MFDLAVLSLINLINHIKIFNYLYLKIWEFLNEHEYILLCITYGAHVIKIKIDENLDGYLMKNVRFATKQCLSLTNFF